MLFDDNIHSGRGALCTINGERCLRSNLNDSSILIYCQYKFEDLDQIKNVSVEDIIFSNVAWIEDKPVPLNLVEDEIEMHFDALALWNKDSYQYYALFIWVDSKPAKLPAVYPRQMLLVDDYSSVKILQMREVSGDLFVFVNIDNKIRRILVSYKCTSIDLQYTQSPQLFLHKASSKFDCWKTADIYKTAVFGDQSSYAYICYNITTIRQKDATASVNVNKFNKGDVIENTISGSLVKVTSIKLLLLDVELVYYFMEANKNLFMSCTINNKKYVFRSKHCSDFKFPHKGIVVGHVMIKENNSASNENTLEKIRIMAILSTKKRCENINETVMCNSLSKEKKRSIICYKNEKLQATYLNTTIIYKQFCNGKDRFFFFVQYLEYDLNGMVLKTFIHLKRNENKSGSENIADSAYDASLTKSPKRSVVTCNQLRNLVSEPYTDESSSLTAWKCLTFEQKVVKLSSGLFSPFFAIGKVKEYPSLTNIPSSKVEKLSQILAERFVRKFKPNDGEVILKNVSLILDSNPLYILIKVNGFCLLIPQSLINECLLYFGENMQKADQHCSSSLIKNYPFFMDAVFDAKYRTYKPVLLYHAYPKNKAFVDDDRIYFYNVQCTLKKNPENPEKALICKLNNDHAVNLDVKRFSSSILANEEQSYFRAHLIYCFRETSWVVTFLFLNKTCENLELNIIDTVQLINDEGRQMYVGPSSSFGKAFRKNRVKIKRELTNVNSRENLRNVFSLQKQINEAINTSFCLLRYPLILTYANKQDAYLETILPNLKHLCASVPLKKKMCVFQSNDDDTCSVISAELERLDPPCLVFADAVLWNGKFDVVLMKVDCSSKNLFCYPCSNEETYYDVPGKIKLVEYGHEAFDFFLDASREPVTFETRGLCIFQPTGLLLSKKLSVGTDVFGHLIYKASQKTWHIMLVYVSSQQSSSSKPKTTPENYEYVCNAISGDCFTGIPAFAGDQFVLIRLKNTYALLHKKLIWDCDYSKRPPKSLTLYFTMRKLISPTCLESLRIDYIVKIAWINRKPDLKNDNDVLKAASVYKGCSFSEASLLKYARSDEKLVAAIKKGRPKVNQFQLPYRIFLCTGSLYKIDGEQGVIKCTSRKQKLSFYIWFNIRHFSINERSCISILNWHSLLSNLLNKQVFAYVFQCKKETFCSLEFELAAMSVWIGKMPNSALKYDLDSMKTPLQFSPSIPRKISELFCDLKSGKLKLDCLATNDDNNEETYNECFFGFPVFEGDVFVLLRFRETFAALEKQRVWDFQQTGQSSKYFKTVFSVNFMAEKMLFPITILSVRIEYISTVAWIKNKPNLRDIDTFSNVPAVFLKQSIECDHTLLANIQNRFNDNGKQSFKDSIPIYLQVYCSTSFVYKLQGSEGLLRCSGKYVWFHIQRLYFKQQCLMDCDDMTTVLSTISDSIVYAYIYQCKSEEKFSGIPYRFAALLVWIDKKPQVSLNYENTYMKTPLQLIDRPEAKQIIPVIKEQERTVATSEKRDLQASVNNTRLVPAENTLENLTRNGYFGQYHSSSEATCDNLPAPVAPKCSKVSDVKETFSVSTETNFVFKSFLNLKRKI